MNLMFLDQCFLGCTGTRFWPVSSGRPEPRFFRVPVAAGTNKKSMAGNNKKSMAGNNKKSMAGTGNMSF